VAIKDIEKATVEAEVPSTPFLVVGALLPVGDNFGFGPLVGEEVVVDVAGEAVVEVAGDAVVPEFVVEVAAGVVVGSTGDAVVVDVGVNAVVEVVTVGEFSTGDLPVEIGDWTRGTNGVGDVVSTGHD
jgi:hypothetical protein